MRAPQRRTCADAGAAGMMAVAWRHDREGRLRAAGADAVTRDFAEPPAVLAALGRVEAPA